MKKMQISKSIVATCTQEKSDTSLFLIPQHIRVVNLLSFSETKWKESKIQRLLDANQIKII